MRDKFYYTQNSEHKETKYLDVIVDNCAIHTIAIVEGKIMVADRHAINEFGPQIKAFFEQMKEEQKGK